VRARRSPSAHARCCRSPIARVRALGWHILRFDADVVLFRPDRIVATVRAELAARPAG
jgi:very-short-patch-repair endonuclease